MVRDKAGQMYLGDFLRAYAATPGVATAGELPGGGALFADCTRAVEPEQRQTFGSWAEAADADLAASPPIGKRGK